MLSVIVYVLAVAFATIIVGGGFMMFRPHSKMDDVNFGKVYLFTFIICTLAPYGYVEILTKSKGEAAGHALRATYNGTNFNGKMNYYKILTANDHAMSALIVGEDHADWGGLEHPVMKVKLTKDDSGQWKAETYKVLASGRLNEDHIVFPPYF